MFARSGTRTTLPSGRTFLTKSPLLSLATSRLSSGVLGQIPRWMTEEGLGPIEMAARIGCTVGSLRVTCCRYRISLRRPQASHEKHDRAGTTVRTGPMLRLPENMRHRLEAKARSLG